MLVASPIALVAFIRFEARLSARGGDPLVALSLFRNGGFAIGLVMALFFYTLSSFYLTFAVYLQSGLHRSPLEAGLATLPFAVGYFASSLASSHVMQRLGVRALTLGFALEVLGFGVVMLAVGNVLADSLELGLVVGGHQSRPRRHRSASRARLGYRDLDLPDRRGARRRRDRRRILRRTRDGPRPRRLCACLQRRARVQRRPARPRRAPLAMARGRSIRRRTCGARAEVSLAATRPFSRNYRVSFQECSPPLSP